MAKWARIVNGTVLEIWEGSQIFPMHPLIAATFTSCPQTVTQGYKFDGTNFTAPPAPPAGYSPPSPVISANVNTNL